MHGEIPRFFVGRIYSTAETRVLTREHLEISFERFTSWATANQNTLARWLELHHSEVSWLKARRIATTGLNLNFDLNELAPELSRLAKSTKIDASGITYAFDSVLKFPIFGELAANNRYLNHPLRDSFLLPTMREEKGVLPPIAVAFRDSVKKLAPKLSLDEYTILLHELRGAVRDKRLHEMAPGQFDREVVREIAATLRLPARVIRLSEVAGVAGGLIRGLGAFSSHNLLVGLAGASLSVGAQLWGGAVPRSTSRIKWLRWALKYDIEDQAEDRG